MTNRGQPAWDALTLGGRRLQGTEVEGGAVECSLEADIRVVVRLEVHGWHVTNPAAVSAKE